MSPHQTGHFPSLLPGLYQSCFLVPSLVVLKSVWPDRPGRQPRGQRPRQHSLHLIIWLQLPGTRSGGICEHKRGGGGPSGGPFSKGHHRPPHWRCSSSPGEGGVYFQPSSTSVCFLTLVPGAAASLSPVSWEGKGSATLDQDFPPCRPSAVVRTQALSPAP